MTPKLKTARLLLYPLELADAAAVQLIFPHWEIVKYMASRVPWPYLPDGALQFYRDVVLPDVERGEVWHWTLRLRTEPERVIGAIELRKVGAENRGFWLGISWQGQGLMTEACNAVTDYWFDTLGFPVLRASKAIPNAASRRISHRQGMRLIATEEREFVSGKLLAEHWEITAEEWRARRSLDR